MTQSDDDFRDLVAKMRSKQRAYSRDRRPQDMDDARHLERQVDRELKAHAEGPTLFDHDRGGRP